MSEDHSINRNQKKKEEGRSAPDFFGSLGKGMVPKKNIETLENSPGLTPLGFGVDVRKRIMDNVDVRNRIMDRNPVSDGLLTTEFTENTDIFKDSSGLTPLRPFVKKHKKEDLE